MKISMSGSTGFIGSALKKKCIEKGWQVEGISRDSLRLPDEEFISRKIEGSEVIINLAGSPISRKWTKTWKKEIYDSRIHATRKIASCIAKSREKPGLFISMSAMGIYDSVHEHTESSQNLDDRFLGQVCRDWEAEALSVNDQVRVVIFRNGLVLGAEGGALKAMYTAFNLGLGGKIGSGTQPVSFIHIDDLVNAFLFVIDTPGSGGIYNTVTPYPTTNAEFSRTLAHALRQTTFITIPASVLRLRLGEGALTLLEGQKVFPERLQQAGFQWKYPTIQNAIVSIYK